MFVISLLFIILAAFLSKFLDENKPFQYSQIYEPDGENKSILIKKEANKQASEL